MQKTWVTHLPHFLDEQGNLPKDLSMPTRRLVKAMCEFVTYAINFEGEGDDVLLLLTGNDVMAR